MHLRSQAHGTKSPAATMQPSGEIVSQGGGGGHVFDPVLTSCFIQLAFTWHKDTGNGAGTYIVVILLVC